MKFLEFQAKEIFSRWGIPVPRGCPIFRSSQLAGAIQKAGGFPVVLKAQVYAGGRGKAGGIVKVQSLKEARQAAGRLLGKRLVTHQTGPRGTLCKALLAEESLSVLKEMYVSVLLDRSKQMPVVVASSEGGMAIEELAKEKPEAIVTTPFDPVSGLGLPRARRIADGMGLPKEHRPAAARQILKLASGFLRMDASLVEVNPWALTKEKGLVALDGKLTLDDSGLFRHPELASLKTADSDSPSEAKSREIGINYVGLEGQVGCMVNGAGLAMATMDLIKLHGGEPANFLDVGGGADVNQVRQAFQLILADPNVKSVLVNIFGGIMKCDVIAQGIIQAAKAIRVRVPLVIRLEGTNVELGRKLLKGSKLGFLTASGLDEAAKLAVKAARR